MQGILRPAWIREGPKARNGTRRTIAFFVATPQCQGRDAGGEHTVDGESTGGASPLLSARSSAPAPPPRPAAGNATGWLSAVAADSPPGSARLHALLFPLISPLFRSTPCGPIRLRVHLCPSNFVSWFTLVHGCERPAFVPPALSPAVLTFRCCSSRLLKHGHRQI